MAKKKSAPAAPPTRDEQIAHAHKQFYNFSRSPASLIGPPTRHFAVGAAVQLGNLKNCVVRDVLENGKALLIEHNVIGTRDNPDPTDTTFQIVWWHELMQRTDLPIGDVPTFTRAEFRGALIQSHLDSLVHLYSHNGIVCNLDYQRTYVWTDADRERLFDSIFNRINIGSFVFVRNHGYLHKGDESLVTYKNLHGETVHVPRSQNYTIEVIDGQQRLTTLIKFISNEFPYRGLRYSELSFHDRLTVLNTLVSYRMIEEDQVDPTELLELFIGVNAGVPMDPAHIATVKARLAAQRKS